MIIIKPSAVGVQFGGKYAVTIECPVCHQPCWRKSMCTFVHEARIELGDDNEPRLIVEKCHKMTKQAVSAVSL